MRLTVVTIFGLVGTLVTGFLGMNLIAAAEEPLWLRALFFLVVLIPLIALILYTIVKSKRLSDFLEALSDERLSNRQNRHLLKVRDREPCRTVRKSAPGVPTPIGSKSIGASGPAARQPPPRNPTRDPSARARTTEPRKYGEAAGDGWPERRPIIPMPESSTGGRAWKTSLSQLCQSSAIGQNFLALVSDGDRREVGFWQVIQSRTRD